MPNKGYRCIPLFKPINEAKSENRSNRGQISSWFKSVKWRFYLVRFGLCSLICFIFHFSFFFISCVIICNIKIMIGTIWNFCSLFIDRNYYEVSINANMWVSQQYKNCFQISYTNLFVHTSKIVIKAACDNL